MIKQDKKLPLFPFYELEAAIDRAIPDFQARTFGKKIRIFAEKLGRKYCAVYFWLNLKGEPTKSVRIKLMELTGNAISPMVWAKAEVEREERIAAAIHNRKIERRGTNNKQ